MKCLSIRQPWASAIIYGGKDIENRTWTTKYRGLLLIHASATFTLDDLQDYEDFVKERFGPKHQSPFSVSTLSDHSGGIIGLVTLTDIVTEHKSRWFVGPYGWVLSDPQPRLFVPYRGQLGLFDVDLTNYSKAEIAHMKVGRKAKQ